MPRAPVISAAVASAVLLGAAGPLPAEFTPWGPLVDESWICYDPADPKLIVHTVNDGDYPLGFDQAKSNDAGRGMNALKFAFGGSNTGHLCTGDPAGSFELWNTGGKAYSDVLLLVAIDAASLPEGFSLSLGPRGQAATQLGPHDDFGYYDPASLGYDCGRPTGLYPSVTQPTGEPLSYCFEKGMVSIVAVPNLSLGGATPSITIDYAFEDLPGKAVFSVYGLIEGAGWIYHTNRGLVDHNDPAAAVSTFEVLPEPGMLVLLACGGLGLLGRRR